MDIQMEDNEQSEESFINVDDYINEAAFESEKCGICMDIVVDRGVLDCCDHWYCFACIDNWATITNLCPLCNKEFQLITCIPVYDTLGNLDVNEHTNTREDNWCIQEKNNTLSFPSYYINEDAVTCLDGDGCKMRNQNSAVEQDPYLDTSIACDSCDTWYHAFCVKFDPENQPENSWLCPRCVNDQVPQEYNLKNIDHGSSVDSTFSGRVSVTVADTGDTAVVVSMVDIDQSTESIMDSYPETISQRQEFSHSITITPVTPLDQGCDPQNLSDHTAPTLEGKLMVTTSTRDAENEIIVPTVNLPEKPTGATVLEDLSLSSQKVIPVLPDLKSESQGQELPSSCPNASSTSSKMANRENQDGLCVELPHSSKSDDDVSEILNIETVSVDQDKLLYSSCNIDASDTGVRLASEDGKLMKNSRKSKSQLRSDDIHTDTQTEEREGGSFRSLEKDHFRKDTGVGLANADGELTKSSRKSKSPLRGDDVDTDTQKEEREAGSFRSSGKVHFKKARLEERPEQANKVDVSVANRSKGWLCSKSSLAESNSSNNFVKKNVSEDIMSIVQEAQHNSSTGLESSSSLNRTAGAPRSRLRVKKIMRRAGDDAESIALVQKLKDEIRDAVQKNPLSSFDKVDAVDKKLLAAFRAAIVKPRNGMDSKFDNSRLPPKNMVLRRGKTRESLTKKIYKTANGRRRSAWARDRNIEFWKHRCASKKPEKVEALKSVLEILKTLRSDPDKSGFKQEPELATEKSILSRVYLADSSVFPRKENLKPLSSLAEVPVGTDIDKNREHRCSNNTDGNSDPFYAKKLVASTKKDFSTPEQVMACSSVHTKRESEELKKKSKVGEGDVPGYSLSKTTDKRKWAMEILARKNASSGTAKTVDKEEDNSTLKTKYPILAQIPVDMRPVLTVSCHNKVPLSIRQAQLYRLTEFYLQKADLPVVCRSAAVELAVADAINVEKAILDKSAGKSVYVNLCSQHIAACRHQKVEQLGPVHYNTTTDASEENENVDSKTVQSFSSAEEALKLTGLLSDSPPESPARPAVSTDGSSQMHAQERGLDNILDTECRPAIDGNGNIDNNLEDANLPKAQNMSDSGSGGSDLQLKLMFSTLRCEKTDTVIGSKEDPIAPIDVNEERPNSLHNVTELEMQTGPISMCGKGETQLPSDTPNIVNPQPDSLEKQICEDISWKENEEFHDPEGISTSGKNTEGNAILPHVVHEKDTNNEATIHSDSEKKTLDENKADGEFPSDGKTVHSDSEKKTLDENKADGEFPSDGKTVTSKSTLEKESTRSNKPQSDAAAVFQKVELYIKEHIRPLCKSGIITVEQYRWAVGKTAEKVMKYHCKAKNANFLIKEGDKVKKLAEQYVEAAQLKEWKRPSNQES